MIEPGLCTSYIADAFRGVHHEDDKYMIALYGAKATLGSFVEKYTAQGEISGPGYRPGGTEISGFDVVEDGRAVVLTFDDIRYERLTVHGVVAGLVYNASKGNRAVGVVALSEPTSSTNGSFTIYFPPATAAEGVFVID